MAEHLTLEVILWTLAFAIECLVIIVGNAVAIAVFWRQRSKLKRTRYLLINLSAADFMVGVCVIDDIVCFALNNQGCKIIQKTILVDSSFAMASLTFLVLISLERLFAVLSPLRQRGTKTSTYFCFISASWVLSAMLFLIIYPIFFHFSINLSVQPVFLSLLQIICLIIICVTYLVIFIYSEKKVPGLQQHQQRQTRKLAKTLFIVASLSVMTWFPHAVINIYRYIGSDILKDTNENGELYRTGQMFRLANSFVNPIVYCFRIPEFRGLLMKASFKRQRDRVFRLRNFNAIAAFPNTLPQEQKRVPTLQHRCNTCL